MGELRILPWSPFRDEHLKSWGTKAGVLFNPTSA
jgi:hypothetical protein